VAGDGKPMISRPSLQEINYRGDRIKRGINLYKVGVDLAKETLYSRSQIEAPGAKYINFPNNLDNDWFTGFCSEVQITKHRNGQPYVVWEKLSGVRNEPLDVSVYALAAAHLAGVTRMNWKKIEKELNEQIIEDAMFEASSNISAVRNDTITSEERKPQAPLTTSEKKPSERRTQRARTGRRDRKV
jgi:phage terminase large subunit GpA-like protein